MANTSLVYKQSDTMNALKHEFQRLIEDQKKLLDPHRKEDSDSELSSDEDHGRANHFTFISAIDVGSHFVDVSPSDELKFQEFQGSYFSQFNIHNPCKNCPIAFYVYTSSPIPVKILPNAGFVQQGYDQTIKIVWEKQQNPDNQKLENSMFFVKCLPLSPDMDIEEMSSHLHSVFNTYNLNILFTTHHLPAKMHLNVFNPEQMLDMQQKQIQNFNKQNKIQNFQNLTTKTSFIGQQSQTIEKKNVTFLKLDQKIDEENEIIQYDDKTESKVQRNSKFNQSIQNEDMISGSSIEQEQFQLINQGANIQNINHGINLKQQKTKTIMYENYERDDTQNEFQN